MCLVPSGVVSAGRDFLFWCDLDRNDIQERLTAYVFFRSIKEKGFGVVALEALRYSQMNNSSRKLLIEHIIGVCKFGASGDEAGVKVDDYPTGEQRGDKWKVGNAVFNEMIPLAFNYLLRYAAVEGFSKNF